MAKITEYWIVVWSGKRPDATLHTDEDDMLSMIDDGDQQLLRDVQDVMNVHDGSVQILDEGDLEERLRERAADEKAERAHYAGLMPGAR